MIAYGRVRLEEFWQHSVHPCDVFYQLNGKRNTPVRIVRNKWEQRSGTIALGFGCRTRKRMGRYWKIVPVETTRQERISLTLSISHFLGIVRGIDDCE